MSSKKNDENSMERFIERYKPVFNHIGFGWYPEGTIATLESDDLYSGLVFGYNDDGHSRERDEFVAKQDERYVWTYYELPSGFMTGSWKVCAPPWRERSFENPDGDGYEIMGYIIATVPYEDGDPEEYLD